MKKVLKVVLGAIPATLTILGAVKAIECFNRKKAKADERKAVEAEDKETTEAVKKFVRLNNLSDDDIWYVNDSGYTPIFAYNRKLNIEGLVIPEGYTLLKLSQPGGETSYALGKMWVNGEVSNHYHILAYFDADCDEQEL